MSPIGPYFQLNSPNNFSANRSVVFKSLYVIVLRLGKTFEDHVFQSNQLGSRVHIWTPERLEQWYGDRRDFLALLPSHATRARHALASLSPLFAWNTQKITPVLQAIVSDDLSTRKPKCSPGTLVLYLSNPPRGPLFPSTNRNQVESCLRNRSTNSEKTLCIESAVLFSSVRKHCISSHHVAVESSSSSISWCKYIVVSFITCFWNRNQLSKFAYWS